MVKVVVFSVDVTLVHHVILTLLTQLAFQVVVFKDLGKVVIGKVSVVSGGSGRVIEIPGKV